MGATRPEHSAEDTGTDVVPETGEETEDEQQQPWTDPQYGHHPEDDPSLSGEDRFDAG